MQEFPRSRIGTTILVITDGAPNNKQEVARVIRDATMRMNADPELSVSFVQIGNDAAASAYLQELDDRIPGCRFDIVDTLKCARGGRGGRERAWGPEEGGSWKRDRYEHSTTALLVSHCAPLRQSTMGNMSFVDMIAKSIND